MIYLAFPLYLYLYYCRFPGEFWEAMSTFGVVQDRFTDPGIEEALLSLFDLDQVRTEERAK